jgi:succinate dehydrogenase/fumarate reductase flavoprotein subunit
MALLFSLLVVTPLTLLRIRTSLAHSGPAYLFTITYSLLKKHRPELWDLPTTNGDHCTGDGQKLAMAIGAKAIDLEKVQVHPTGLVDPKDPEAKVKFLAAEALRGVGGLLLDAEGQRFADELGHRDYVTGRMWENKKVRGSHQICLIYTYDLRSTPFGSSSTAKHLRRSSGIASTMSAVVS